MSVISGEREIRGGLENPLCLFDAWFPTFVVLENCFCCSRGIVVVRLGSVLRFEDFEIGGACQYRHKIDRGQAASADFQIELPRQRKLNSAKPHHGHVPSLRISAIERKAR